MLYAGNGACYSETRWWAHLDGALLAKYSVASSVVLSLNARIS